MFVVVLSSAWTAATLTRQRVLLQFAAVTLPVVGSQVHILGLNGSNGW